MEQLMKTMHAIQEAVVASRVEIAASHADNEELRKTNEELHIDLWFNRLFLSAVNKNNLKHIYVR